MENRKSMITILGSEAWDIVANIANIELERNRGFSGREKVIAEMAEMDRAGEVLASDGAALLASLKAVVALTYFAMYTEAFLVEEERGIDTYEISPNGERVQVRAADELVTKAYQGTLYRIMYAYRQIEYLRLIGAISTNLLEGNRLYLGCGAMVEDVCSTSYEFKVFDTDILIKYAQMEDVDNSVEFRRGIIDDWVSRGIIDIQRRNGRIICVDNDSELISLGQRWIAAMGIDLEARVMNAKDFMNKEKRYLRGLGLAGIFALRLDPRLAGGKPDHPEYARRVVKFVDSLKYLLRRSPEYARAVFTIGTGNRQFGESMDTFTNWHEFKQRQKVMQSIMSKFPKSSFHMSNIGHPDCGSWIEEASISDIEILTCWM